LNRLLHSKDIDQQNSGVASDEHIAAGIR